MLPPIRAVSGAVAPVVQSEAAVVSETLSSLVAAPDAAVALSMAASAGVEGKLNMLLIAARARMVDSLFAAIDAISAALNTPQKQGETTIAFALRLADSIGELTPTQLDNVQQQVNAQVKALPLPLIAQALQEPTGPAAAQVVAYLEVVKYKERDLATKAVVGSYGLNDGQPDAPVAAEMRPQAMKQMDAPTINLSVGQIVAGKAMSLSADAVGTLKTPPTPAADPALSTQAPEVGPEKAEGAGVVVPPGAAVTGEAKDAKVAAAVLLPIAAAVPNEATTSPIPVKVSLPPQTDLSAQPQPVAQASVPRQIQQIEAAVQEGLKVVVHLAIEVAGPELLQIMAQGEPLADKVVAQALVADMMDSVTLQFLPQTAAPDPTKAPAVALASASTSQPILASEELSQTGRAVLPASEPPAPSAVPLAAAQMQAVVVPVVGVPFAIAQYLPTHEIVAEREDIFIDSVDPVDDEKQGQGQPGGQAEDDAANGEEPDDQAPARTISLASEDDGDGIAAEEAPKASVEPKQLALPASVPLEPLRDRAYDLYQRMVGWD
jgi:hypothetical protein